jgi:hypothetical protein
MDVKNLEEYVNVEADRQSPADTQDDAQSQNSMNPTHLKCHSYAMIKVHKNAARVIRWEVVDDSLVTIQAPRTCYSRGSYSSWVSG